MQLAWYAQKESSSEQGEGFELIILECLWPSPVGNEPCLPHSKSARQVSELVLFTELFWLQLHRTAPPPGLCMAENREKATVGQEQSDEMRAWFNLNPPSSAPCLCPISISVRVSFPGMRAGG